MVFVIHQLQTVNASHNSLTWTFESGKIEVEYLNFEFIPMLMFLLYWYDLTVLKVQSNTEVWKHMEATKRGKKPEVHKLFRALGKRQ